MDTWALQRELGLAPRPRRRPQTSQVAATGSLEPIPEKDALMFVDNAGEEAVSAWREFADSSAFLRLLFLVGLIAPAWWPAWTRRYARAVAFVVVAGAVGFVAASSWARATRLPNDHVYSAIAQALMWACGVLVYLGVAKRMGGPIHERVFEEFSSWEAVDRHQHEIEDDAAPGGSPHRLQSSPSLPSSESLGSFAEDSDEILCCTKCARLLCRESVAPATPSRPPDFPRTVPARARAISKVLFVLTIVVIVVTVVPLWVLNWVVWSEDASAEDASNRSGFSQTELGLASIFALLFELAVVPAFASLLFTFALLSSGARILHLSIVRLHHSPHWGAFVDSAFRRQLVGPPTHRPSADGRASMGPRTARSGAPDDVPGARFGFPHVASDTRLRHHSNATEYVLQAPLTLRSAASRATLATRDRLWSDATEQSRRRARARTGSGSGSGSGTGASTEVEGRGGVARRGLPRPSNAGRARASVHTSATTVVAPSEDKVMDVTPGSVPGSDGAEDSNGTVCVGASDPTSAPSSSTSSAVHRTTLPPLPPAASSGASTRLLASLGSFPVLSSTAVSVLPGSVSSPLAVNPAPASHGGASGVGFVSSSSLHAHSFAHLVAQTHLLGRSNPRMLRIQAPRFTEEERTLVHAASRWTNVLTESYEHEAPLPTHSTIRVAPHATHGTHTTHASHAVAAVTDPTVGSVVTGPPVGDSAIMVTVGTVATGTHPFPTLVEELTGTDSSSPEALVSERVSRGIAYRAERVHSFGPSDVEAESGEGSYGHAVERGAYDRGAGPEDASGAYGDDHEDDGDDNNDDSDASVDSEYAFPPPATTPLAVTGSDGMVQVSTSGLLVGGLPIAEIEEHLLPRFDTLVYRLTRFRQLLALVSRRLALFYSLSIFLLFVISALFLLAALLDGSVSGVFFGAAFFVITFLFLFAPAFVTARVRRILPAMVDATDEPLALLAHLRAQRLAVLMTTHVDSDSIRLLGTPISISILWRLGSVLVPVLVFIAQQVLRNHSASLLGASTA